MSTRQPIGLQIALPITITEEKQQHQQMVLPNPAIAQIHSHVMDSWEQVRRDKELRGSRRLSFFNGKSCTYPHRSSVLASIILSQRGNPRYNLPPSMAQSFENALVQGTFNLSIDIDPISPEVLTVAISCTLPTRSNDRQWALNMLGPGAIDLRSCTA
jgi:hypothetical protein